MTDIKTHRITIETDEAVWDYESAEVSDIDGDSFKFTPTPGSRVTVTSKDGNRRGVIFVPAPLSWD